ASMRSTNVAGPSNSVSRVPGAPPRTSTDATAGASHKTTVVPVMAAESSAWPTSSPGTSVIRLRGPGSAISSLHVKMPLPSDYRCCRSDAMSTTLIKNAAWAIVWDEKLGRQVYRRGVDVAFSDDRLSFVGRG